MYVWYVHVCVQGWAAFLFLVVGTACAEVKVGSYEYGELGISGVEWEQGLVTGKASG